MTTRQDEVVRASSTLLSAALCGLFAATAAGCESSDGSGARVTASRLEPGMTLEKFTAECDAQGGAIELHAHCGGMNTCAGFSYDTGTQLLIEHTCRQLNTCSGYSCVVPEEPRDV